MCVILVHFTADLALSVELVMGLDSPLVSFHRLKDMKRVIRGKYF